MVVVTALIVEALVFVIIKMLLSVCHLPVAFTLFIVAVVVMLIKMLAAINDSFVGSLLV